MPGIYIHIPFCKKACHYCNFHFSTSLGQKNALLQALHRELEWQKDYLNNVPLQSVYLGGGTPSILDIGELEALFQHISSLHSIEPGAEITLEANPDDLSPEKLRALKTHTPVNRLSIGIQSFFEADLQWMNRAHNASEARACLENALSQGFDDLSIDLIYGAPTTPDEHWAENLRIAIEYGIPHLSSYCLTVEEGTALGSWVKKGKMAPMDEARGARQFEMLMDATATAGYEHYEISNFAQPGRYARHNTSYWQDQPYLGVGPSAHSFDGVSRQWNVAHNADYIHAINEGKIPFEREILSAEQRYNEYVMTSLRTMWGADLAKIRQMGDTFVRHFEQTANPLLLSGVLLEAGGLYRLSRSGKLLADHIAMELFV